MSDVDAPASYGMDYLGGVYTGTELLVWGVHGGNIAAGHAYNYTTNIWRDISIINQPSNRQSFSTIWTGIEMII